MDPDPDTDRNESTNVPISKLRIETKPKRFDVFTNLKWNVSVYSKNFGTKPKLFDVFQLFFSKSKTLLNNPRNFRSERERWFDISTNCKLFQVLVIENLIPYPDPNMLNENEDTDPDSASKIT